MENVHDEGGITKGMVPVSWPVTFGSLSSQHFVSRGMILGVTASGCHIAGTMPLEVGMRLHMWGCPPAKPAPLSIRAIVVWVRGHEFGLDFHSLGAEDQQWLTEFLAEAQRQLLSQAA